MTRILIVVAILIGFSTTALAKRKQRPAVNEAAPEITTKNQKWANSKPLSLADLKGHVVILDFWDTTCGPCMKGLPHMEQLYQQHKDRGLVVIGITSQPMAEGVVGAALQKGVTFPLLGSNENFNEAVSDRYELDGIPAAVVIGKDGKVRWRASGFAIEREIDSAVQQALRR